MGRKRYTAEQIIGILLFLNQIFFQIPHSPKKTEIAESGSLRKHRIFA
jgi:hypothetical protein